MLVVEGGWQRGVLAAVRSLGRAGHHVTVAAEHRGLAARSRYAAAWLPLPPVGSLDLVPAVADAVARTRAEVVFAGDDEHLLQLSPARERLGAQLLAPPREVLLRAMDKASLTTAAVAAGVPVPQTRLDPPPDSRGWLAKRRLHLGGDAHAVIAAPRDLPADGSVLYQRVVDGRLLAVVVLVGPDGSLLHMAAQEAGACYPEPFGVSARARTVPLDPDLAAGCRRLLTSLGWTGLAELQFLAPKDGPPVLIDLNPRFFGSLALQMAAGADLPAAWLEAALTGTATVGAASPGTRYHWLEGDLRRSLAGPRPLLATLGTLCWAARATHSIWSLRDPRPGLALTAILARRALRRGAPAAAS